MKQKILLRFRSVLMLMLLLVAGITNAQTTNCTNHTNNNGSSMVTFNVQNTNSGPIQITAISNVVTGTAAWNLLYNTTAIASSGSTWTQGTIGANQNGWVDAGTQTLTVTSSTSPQTILSGLTITIPGGATYGFALSSASCSYMSLGTGVNTFAAGGVNLLTGDNISWGGAAAPATPVNYPRGFLGCITWVPLSACTAPPTPGTANVSNPTPCFGQTIGLGLSGASIGSGMTYQWEDSLSTGTTWTPVAGATIAAPNVIPSGSGAHYYHCAVTCSGNTQYSTPVLVTVPTPFPGGTYTIDQTQVTGGTNFHSFTDAVSAIGCGISGPIVFNVAASTTAYVEQITLPATIGATATNTVTFNGNGDTLRYNSTNSAQPWTVGLNGADHITFNNLVVQGQGATYAMAMHLWNQADSNTFSGCTFMAPANGSSSTQVPFSISGSATSPTTSGISGDGNLVTGCTMFSGYYNTVLYGNSASSNIGNKIVNCNLEDFYFYGSYNVYQNGAQITNNIIERPTRTTLSTFYGIYLSSGCTNVLVNKNRVRNAFGAALTNTSTAYCIYPSVVATLGNENIIQNNLISDINSNGSIYGIYLSGAGFIKVYHNTVSLDYTASTAGTTYGIYNSGTSAIDIENNNVSITRGGSGAKYCLYYSSNPTISNHNNVYINSAAGTNYVGYNVANYATLANWQTANGGAWDGASVSLIPNFNSPSTGDYTATNAAIDNYGTPLGVLTDILGVTRSTTHPDLGCYEYTPPACTGTPTGGTALTSNANPCFNLPITLSLTGNTAGSGITFQWQDSLSTGTTWTTLSGQNNNVVTFTPATAGLHYYQCVVTCTGSSSTVYSTLVAVNVPTPMGGGTYTIDQSQPTAGTNYHSFGDAVSAIACGVSGPVVFNVVASTTPYNEQVTIPATINTTAVNTVTFNGNGDTLTYNSTNSAQPWTIGLFGADHVTFNNLVVVGQGASYALVCHLWNQADSNTFSGCTFMAPANGTSTTQVPFSISGSATSGTTTGTSGNGNLVTGCTMFSGYYNTCLVGNTSPLGQNNTVMNSNLEDFYFYGAYVYYQNGAHITNNIIERPTRTTLSTFYGTYLTTGDINCLVNKNRIRNPFGAAPTNTSSAYGVYTPGSATLGNENIIQNNIVSDFNSGGTLYGIYLTSSTYYKVYHNTISFDDQTSTSTSTVYGLYSTGGSGIDIRNNNISITRAGASTKYGLYYSGAKTSNYNNIYVNAPAGSNYIGYNGSTISTLAAWITAGAANYWDTASKSLLPMYVSPGAGDYTPSNAFLDNKGTPVGVLTDITGAARSTTTPDIGAYEFYVPTCTGTPTAGTATGPAIGTACSGINFSLNLSGYTVGAGITLQWQYYDPILSMWTDITGATTPTLTTNITTSTDFRCQITCVFGGGSDVSNTVTIAPSPFYICYCSPLTGTNLTGTNSYNYISNVNIATTSLNNTTTSGGYNQFYPTTATTTTTLTQGVQYTLSATGAYSAYNMAAWLDIDGNGVFDAGEQIQMSNTSGTTYTATFTIPYVSTTGLTGLRLMFQYSAYAAGAACTTANYEAEDYVVNIAQAVACSGTPSAGTAYGFTSICAGAAFTVYDTAYTVGTGITVQWQSSPAGTNTWSNILGATNASYTVAAGITAATDYRMYIVCSNSSTSDTSNILSVGISPFYQCYCASNATSTGDEDILNVTFAGINNTSACGVAASGPGSIASEYSNYTQSVTPAQVTQGSAYPFSVGIGECLGNNYNNVTGIFIDLNHNGSFADPGEQVYVAPTYGYGVHTETGNITIPITADTGFTGMRVVTVETTGTITSCGTYSWGETEDYTIHINAATGCTGTPSAGVAYGPANACSGNPFTLHDSTFTIASGITYQWQSSPSGMNTWSDIAGANSPSSYTVASQTVATDYRMKDSCGNSMLVSYSNTVVVGQNIPSNCYCVPVGTSNSTYAINNFSTSGNLQNISNLNSGLSAGGYGDFTNDTLKTAPGSTVNFYVAWLTSTIDCGYAIWIDYDQNGSFADPGETVYNTTSYIIGSINGSFVIPSTAPLGTTRMRIMNNYVSTNPNTQYCVSSSPTYSEFEDYTVQLLSPLAIKLTDISATNVSTRNRVDWTTGSENKGDYFIVERSADGRNFTTMGNVNAKGTASTYSYWDENPYGGINYYRLKMMDAAGNSNYSKVVTATMKGNGAFTVDAYPNPVSNDLTVKVYGNAGSNAMVTITDVTGKVVKAVTMENNKATIDMSALASGMYLVKYTDNDHSQILKVNKK